MKHRSAAILAPVLSLLLASPAPVDAQATFRVQAGVSDWIDPAALLEGGAGLDIEVYAGRAVSSRWELGGSFGFKFADEQSVLAGDGAGGFDSDQEIDLVSLLGHLRFFPLTQDTGSFPAPFFGFRTGLAQGIGGGGSAFGFPLGGEFGLVTGLAGPLQLSATVFLDRIFLEETFASFELDRTATRLGVHLGLGWKAP